MTVMSLRTSTITKLADISRYWADTTPNGPALTAGGRHWTYAELESESRQVAHGLSQAGVRAGDRIAFLDKNSPEYFTHLFGGAKLNAVSVAVNWRLAPPEIEFILNDAHAKVLFLGEEFLDHWSTITVPSISQVIVIGDPGDSGLIAYDDWIAAFAPTSGEDVEDIIVDIAGDDTCYQLYTSGTTGLPKGVELTNDNLFATMNGGSEQWGFDTNTVNLVAMPLFHIAGSGWAVGGMASGVHTIMTREVNPMEIIQVIPQHKITHALLVPAVLQFLLIIPEAAEADYSSMELLVYGASPITEEVLVGALQLLQCDFVQVYGLTETTGAIIQLDPLDHDPGGERAHLLRAAGKPWDIVDVRIVNLESMQDQPEGEVGEIWVRTPQNMKGYWNNPEATASAFVDGYFRTGDAGFMRDGYIYIHDRVKDMIVSGGENIYPAEVENALMKHPGVGDVAVIGVPDDKWGETPKALVVRRDETLTEDDLLAFAREHLARYKCPSSVDWVTELPRNPSGKILKAELRKPFWEGRERLVN